MKDNLEVASTPHLWERRVRRIIHGMDMQTDRGVLDMPPSTPQIGPYGSSQQEQQFQWSQCTGRKKALCIGINYTGTDAELRGCINDARNMKQFLISTFGFKSEDIVMLLDDATHPRQIPTRENIVGLRRSMSCFYSPVQSLPQCNG